MSISDLFRKKHTERTRERKIGDIGEDIACEYLKKHGYEITDRNARISYKELDIVAEDEYYTVFVEVKTLSLSKEEAERNSHRASEQIGQEKANNIMMAARSWHNKHYNGKSPRIDVIEVYLGDDPPSVVHTENAINRLSLYRKRR